jgi:cyclopropane fatty-acyl-phospholipid synthase-like methyltransferase
MKSMKLYDRVERIHNELALIDGGSTGPLTVDQLTPFDQYHYLGTDAVDHAIAALGLTSETHVLDIGSGIGGPARYIADRTGAHVTALELQPDLDTVAAELTTRCALSHLVEHRCGNVLDGVGETYDAIVSFLCFLHIGDRLRLLAACRDALKPGRAMYVEDFAKAREPTSAEAEMLRVKVQCPGLPTPDEYEAQLRGAGFDEVHIDDVTQQWTAFTRERLEQFRAARARNVAVHGAEIVDGLDDFYATIVRLFEGGAVGGVTILAR